MVTHVVAPREGVVINRTFYFSVLCCLSIYILCHFLSHYNCCYRSPRSNPLLLRFLLLPSIPHTMVKSKYEPVRRRRSLSDPLAAALLPPPNESPVQREMRLKAETEARKVSDGIDEMISKERSERKRSKAEVNVLLLGQSESGKSTTLKREFLFPPSQHHLLPVYTWFSRYHSLFRLLSIPTAKKGWWACQDRPYLVSEPSLCVSVLLTLRPVDLTSILTPRLHDENSYACETRVVNTWRLS